MTMISLTKRILLNLNKFLRLLENDLQELESEITVSSFERERTSRDLYEEFSLLERITNSKSHTARMN